MLSCLPACLPTNVPPPSLRNPTCLDFARAGLGNAQAALEAMDREEELALAHAHHAALFAKMDRMEPARDEWHMKWQAIEADAEQMVS
jgi:hypothetical protein